MDGVQMKEKIDGVQMKGKMDGVQMKGEDGWCSDEGRRWMVFR